MNADSEQACHAPNSPLAVFWGFSTLAIQGFGGVLAVAQRELVEKRRWVSKLDFVEQWAVAQVLPGPNVVNLAIMLGDRWFGLRGAVAALAGMLFFPSMVVIAIVALAGPIAQHPAFVGALHGMGAVCAGLVAAAGLRLTPALKQNPMPPMVSTMLVALTFVAIVWLKWPLLWVLAGIGGAACLWAWRSLLKRDAEKGQQP
jgi:chromate transporter